MRAAPVRFNNGFSDAGSVYPARLPPAFTFRLDEFLCIDDEIMIEFAGRARRPANRCCGSH
jgi:hypothetical protein